MITSLLIEQTATNAWTFLGKMFSENRIEKCSQLSCLPVHIFILVRDLGLLFFSHYTQGTQWRKHETRLKMYQTKGNCEKYEGKFSDQKDRVGIQFVGYLAMQQKNV